MKKNWCLFLGIFLLIGVQTSVFAQNESKLQWYSIEEAVKLNEKNPKKFFIDVYTDWCGWCKVMDQRTFSHPTIAALINKYYYPVKLNAEQKQDIVLGEKTYKFVPQGNKGYHELAAALLNGNMSYPSIVYLDEKLNMLQPIPGFQTPEQIEPILIYFGTNASKTTQWDDFTKTFKSSLP